MVLSEVLAGSPRLVYVLTSIVVRVGHSAVRLVAGYGGDAQRPGDEDTQKLVSCGTLPPMSIRRCSISGTAAGGAGCELPHRPVRDGRSDQLPTAVGPHADMPPGAGSGRDPVQLLRPGPVTV